MNEAGGLRGLITIKDIEKAQAHPNASTDAQGRLLVAAAVGVGHDRDARVAALVGAGVDAVVIDTAHGHRAGVIRAVAEVRAQWPELQIVAGNVATAAATKALIEVGVDAVKVGIGPGSICTTRIVAGVGVPRLLPSWTAWRLPRAPMSRSLRMGALSSVEMLLRPLPLAPIRSWLAVCWPVPKRRLGPSCSIKAVRTRHIEAWEALGRWRRGVLTGIQEGKESKKLVPEGIEGRVPYRGPISDTIYQLIGGLRAGMGYTGSANIDGLRKETSFVQITAAGLRESHVHDVVVTHEAPNYRID